MVLNALVCVAFSFISIGIIYGVYMMIRDDRRNEKRKKEQSK